MKKILVVAAHPDDEILGCGGTIARLAGEGCEAYSLILGEGITSRDDKRVRGKRSEDIKQLKGQISRADKIVGIKKVFAYDLPDNRFDTVALLDIIKIIESVMNTIKPDIIFTHYKRDLNIDHQLTYQAAITAARPSAEESVREIYSFEIPSSTEWGFPLSFSPDVFFDIENTLKLKLKAMAEYKTELKDFPHPRSLKGITMNAGQWGMKIGLRYAEAFECVRVIK
ncbi:MAG: PIG-L family deacetylase [Nitrospirae bacterium]|nr:PIG-L family deacetylase [Nitrospirota bacterium]